LSAKLLSFIPGWAPKNKKHVKQKAMAKLLHSKPTHSFTNSHSQAAFCIYLFIYFILFYFWQTDATFEPNKVSRRIFVSHILENCSRQI
jgi:hypothetical protein